MYTTCRVGVLSSEISKHSKISPPPSLRSHLTSSPMGVFSGDYGMFNKLQNSACSPNSTCTITKGVATIVTLADPEFHSHRLMLLWKKQIT